jgi:hypothetical protein
VTPCNLTVHRRFDTTNCLHLQDRRVNWGCRWQAKLLHAWWELSSLTRVRHCHRLLRWVDRPSVWPWRSLHTRPDPPPHRRTVPLFWGHLSEQTSSFFFLFNLCLLSSRSLLPLHIVSFVSLHLYADFLPLYLFSSVSLSHFLLTVISVGASGIVMVKPQCYKSEDHGFETRWR